MLLRAPIRVTRLLRQTTITTTSTPTSSTASTSTISRRRLQLPNPSFTTMSSAAPPTTTASSPPAKRVKTDNETSNGTTTSTMTATAAAEQIPSLQVKKLSPAGRLPTRGSEFAAGYDMYASKDTTVPARGKVLVATDISIAVPPGTYGRVAPRSGLASKHFIDTGAGVIDADYRGEVKVLLFNHAEADYEIKEGDRIAQLVLERIVTPDVVEVEELAESVRGAGGFGSTGYGSK